MYTPLCGTLTAAMSHKLGACITRTRRRRSADAFDAFEIALEKSTLFKSRNRDSQEEREKHFTELIILNNDLLNSL